MPERGAQKLEGSFPDLAIDEMAEGLLDICILYLPWPHPGIVYETLAVDQVVLVQHTAQTGPWTENYILMDWGLEFRSSTTALFAGLVNPAYRPGWSSSVCSTCCRSNRPPICRSAPSAAISSAAR